MIGIIETGIGNSGSVKNSLKFLGIKSKSIFSAKDFSKVEKIIFPGVGNFGKASEKLFQSKLDEKIKEEIENGKEFLGICLGMQLFFEKSEEAPKAKGLCVLNGTVKKFEKGKVPQIGWNFVESNYKLLESGNYYFVNSYYCAPSEKEIVVGKTFYGVNFVSAVKKGNVLGVQFHPEKSGKAGLDFLKKWCEC